METKQKIISKLTRLIYTYPSLRVGQIIVNAANIAGWKLNDVFYCDDEILLKGIEELLSDHS